MMHSLATRKPKHCRGHGDTHAVERLAASGSVDPDMTRPIRFLSPFRPILRRAAVLLVCSACALAPRAHAQTFGALTSVNSTLGKHGAELIDAARQFGLSPTWLGAVMQAESGGDATARSPKGAIGLMQLMPDTYADMRRMLGLGPDPWRPADNLLAGAGYLRMLTDRFGASGALAAYNAGPGRYERWLSGTASLPSETRAYVVRVRSQLQSVSRTTPSRPVMSPLSSPRSAPLFPRLSAIDAAAGSQPETVDQHGGPTTQTGLSSAASLPINPLFASVRTENRHP